MSYLVHSNLKKKEKKTFEKEVTYWIVICK